MILWGRRSPALDLSSQQVKCNTEDTVLLPPHRKIPAVRGTIRTVDISDQGNSSRGCLFGGSRELFGCARRKRRARSLKNKGQERVAAQTDSEVFTAALGVLSNTLRRWGFYEKLNFLYDHIGFGNKWDFRINIGTVKTWGRESHKILANQRHQRGEYQHTKE